MAANTSKDVLSNDLLFGECIGVLPDAFPELTALWEVAPFGLWHR